MISNSTIDKVFEVARVEEVISDFVQLKRSGANYKGLSPFTSERTPSFMVSGVKQIWKDFSSGKGGNVITFLMEHEHLSYPEAIRYLAKKYNIEIEETETSSEQKQEIQTKESMYLVSEYAQTFFQQTLLETDSGKAIALPYFKERGFTKATIEKFKLGYSPDKWTAFTDDALSKGYQLEFLEGTGLTIVKGDKKLDRFKGRVMFPIHSVSGRVLGFGGRTLSLDRNTAKYLNSPESEIYHKSKVLYGIYFAKKAIAKSDMCYLVEGYTDVIQMHQSGIENVVSSSGTALTPDQILLIRRLTSNITLLFDSDEAGLRAALRGVDLILEQGMNVRICTFPEGEDPDSFARKNSEEDIKRYLDANTKDFIEFKASLLMRQSKGDPIVRAEVIRDMVRSISKIQDGIQREVYIKECSRIMEVSEQVLFSSVAQALSVSMRVKPTKSEPAMRAEVQKKETSIENRLKHIESELLKCLLLYGNHLVEFEEEMFEEKDGGVQVRLLKRQMSVYEKCYLELQQDELQVSSEGFQKMFQNILTQYQAGHFRIEDFLKGIDPQEAQNISSILMEDETRQLHDWAHIDITVKSRTHDLSEQVMGCILNLRLCYIDKIVHQMKDGIVQSKEVSDKNQLIEDILRYIELQKRLATRLRRIVY